MEILLIFALFMSGSAKADEVTRLQKRESGYEAFLRELAEAEKIRKAAASKKKIERQREALAYRQIRRTFKRRTWVPDPKHLRVFEQQQEERKLESLWLQKKFAQYKKSVREKIEERAIRLKYREYQLKR